MVFGAIVNGMDSLISLSSVSLFMYRNATDSCALILYPAPLLNCCMSSSNLGVESLGFLYRVSCHLQIMKFSFYFADLDTFDLVLSSDCCCKDF